MKTIYDLRYRSMINWLVEARKKQGLSQAQVAAKLKVPRVRITKIESYDRRLDILELHEMATLYGISMAEIVSRLSTGEGSV